ncbi:MAG: DMT family transporter [Methylobacterium mesophilicum]|nr:DMT family transporter [Methylobacterium mesophilicum]
MTSSAKAVSNPLPVAPAIGSERVGALLVLLSAVAWSSSGTLALYLVHLPGWAVVFWRTLWAAGFLFGFMVWRDGLSGTLALFRRMGLPGVAVAVCFGIASASFVLAVSLTTVANIVLIQAGVPLIAALLAFVLFRERVALPTWIAIAAVISGVAVMVSDSFAGGGSVAGNGLALLIAVCFAVATVMTRRFSHVRMTPASCLGMLLTALFAATQAPSLSVGTSDFALLAGFGALNLGLGLALFASGARLIPAALAALLGTMETVLSPIWVWLIHDQVPASRTLIGGAIVFAALLLHLGLEFARQRRPQKPGTTGVNLPQ